MESGDMLVKTKEPMTDGQIIKLRNRVLEIATTGKDAVRRKAMKMYVWLTAEMMRRGL
jgi:hypothetical protein